MGIMKSTVFCLLISSAFLACGQVNTSNNEIPMSERKNFSWAASVTAPTEYPIEIHAGYLATSEKPICALVNGGVEDNGWQATGSGESGGRGIPSQLALTWVSYAEKKFWKIDTVIDSAKILASFREGFIYRDRN